MAKYSSSICIQLTGKLFKSEELWKLVEFILLFYQDKPVDWLLSHFFSVRYCKLDYTHVSYFYFLKIFAVQNDNN